MQMTAIASYYRQAEKNINIAYEGKKDDSQPVLEFSKEDYTIDEDIYADSTGN